MSDLRPGRGAARLLRGALVGLLTVALGSIAHASAGGMLPSATALAAVAGVIAAVSVALSSRRWTARPLVAVFLLAQAGVHVTSMLGAPMDHGGGSTVAMLVAHVAAAALLVLAVSHGERTLWTLVERIALRGPDLSDVSPVVRSSPVVVCALVARGSAVPADLLGRAPPVVA